MFGILTINLNKNYEKLQNKKLSTNKAKTPTPAGAGRNRTEIL